MASDPTGLIVVFVIIMIGLFLLATFVIALGLNRPRNDQSGQDATQDHLGGRGRSSEVDETNQQFPPPEDRED